MMIYWINKVAGWFASPMGLEVLLLAAGLTMAAASAKTMPVDSMANTSIKLTIRLICRIRTLLSAFPPITKA